MFVQMKWHKSSPDGQTVEFALVGPRLDQDRVEIASLLNSLNKKKKKYFFIMRTIRFHYS
jgi:hypothetical protein